MSIPVSFTTLLAETLALKQYLGFDFLAVFLGKDVFLVIWVQDFPFDLAKGHVVFLVEILSGELGEERNIQ